MTLPIRPLTNSSRRPFSSCSKENGPRRSSCSPNCFAKTPRTEKCTNKGPCALLALGNVHGSLADAEKGVEYAPDDSESYYVRGRAYLESHQHDNAIADFTHYLAAEDNEGTNPGRIGYAYYYRGLARAQMNDFTSAMADFSRALRCHPKLAMAYQARAVAHDALGAVRKPQADREMAERLDREDRGS